MTTHNILATREAGPRGIRGRVAHVNGATGRNGLQTHAGAVTLELGA